MSKRPFIFGGIMLIIALVIGGLFWYTQNIRDRAADVITESNQQDNVADSGNRDNLDIQSLIDTSGENKLLKVDTSNWQTYRNEELGFEVKIPKDWEMRELYKEDDKVVNIWFSQKGKSYESEGCCLNAIGASFSLKSNPFFHYPEVGLKSWYESYHISIQNIIVNGIPFYYYQGYGEGIDTTSSFPKDYTFSLSSSLELSGSYANVRKVLHGMIQSVKFD